MHRWIHLGLLVAAALLWLPARAAANTVYADLDKVNPGSMILSGEMMLRYMGWLEAADAIIGAMDRSIAQKTVTYDFARLMDGATEVKCSEFGDILIRNL